MSIDAEDDARWMRAALALARRGIGRTAPNPAVGCVLVRDGRLLGRGWTKPGGRPHAERVALDQAAAQFGPDAARGATAYVTLEPCAHHGRTPPCADALVASGVARVVACLTDPDPRVQGRGFARLREAGIATECGLMAAEAAEINAGFLMRHRLGRPWLTLKMAASLDGRIATASGESRWITGPQARARVHLMRARADAILVGAGTLRADDPALDVRLPGLAEAAPLPVLLDPRLTLPPESRLAQGAAARPTLAFHAPGVDAGRAGTLAAMGVELAEAPAEDGMLDLSAIMAALGARGITRAFCEGGGALAAALLRADLVDEIAWFSAGTALGAEGRPAIGPLGLDRLADAHRFALASVERVGADTLSLWRRA